MKSAREHEMLKWLQFLGFALGVLAMGYAAAHWGMKGVLIVSCAWIGSGFIMYALTKRNPV